MYVWEEPLNINNGKATAQEHPGNTKGNTQFFLFCPISYYEMLSQTCSHITTWWCVMKIPLRHPQNVYMNHPWNAYIDIQNNILKYSFVNEIYLFIYILFIPSGNNFTSDKIRQILFSFFYLLHIFFLLAPPRYHIYRYV